MDEQLALIELYEYKVSDLMQGQIPRGGRRSVLELRERLLQEILDAPLIRRFGRVDYEYRLLRQKLTATETRSGQTESRSAGQGQASIMAPTHTEPALASGVSAEELAAWTELRTLAWFREVQETLNALALRARSEPGHATLRVMYAVTETAERTLRGVTEPFPVPKSDDPLMSLGDREIALQLARAFSELLLTPAGEQALSEALARAHADPFPRHPDEELLASRIQAVEREPMSAAARTELISALRRQFPQAPDPRERPAVRYAAKQLREIMDALVMSRPVVTGVAKDSILYSEHPYVGLAVPPEQSQELVIYLAGEGQDTYWHGLHLRWQESRGDWQFFVNNQLVLLRPTLDLPERHLSVEVNQETVQIYHTASYVLLRHTLVPRVALQELARHAQVTALLLDPTESFANLRLTRAVARFIRDGHVTAEDYAAGSGVKYTGVSNTELLNFARQGATTLSTRAAQLTETQWAETLQTCAAAIGVRASRAQLLLQGLQQVFVSTHDLQGEHELHLSSEGSFLAFEMPTHPTNLHFRDRTVTLNWDYKGDIAVLLPGGSAGANSVLRDVLVLPLNSTCLVLVRHDRWVAATIMANGNLT